MNIADLKKQHKEIIAEHIIINVCKNNGVAIESIKMPSRTRYRSDLRFICFYYIRKETGLRLCDIGKLFGKEHSTVSAGIKKFDELKNDKSFKQLIIKSGFEI